MSQAIAPQPQAQAQPNFYQMPQQQPYQQQPQQQPYQQPQQQPQSFQAGGYNNNQQGGGYGGRGGYSRGRGRGRNTNNQPQLPEGWASAYTPEGQIYYIDHSTRTTHWEIPAHLQQQPQRRGIDQTKRKTKMCMNASTGNCRWGDSCAFAHHPSELQQTGPTEQQ